MSDGRHSKLFWLIPAVILIIAGVIVMIPRRHAGHEVGTVNTAFKLIGPDHKIVIESYDDPKVQGITVFVSESRTGGVKGGLGMAQDTSDYSIAVRQTGPVRVTDSFDSGDDVFSEKRSIVFKRLHVSRFWDKDHKAFVYLVWSDKLLNGSPANSISAIVPQAWPGDGGIAVEPDLRQLAPQAQVSTAPDSPPATDDAAAPADAPKGATLP